MSAPVRFLFDTDFGAPKARAAAPRVVALDDHQSALAQAQAAGYERGEADGRRSAREADASRLTDAIDTLGAQVASTLAEAEIRAAEVETAAVALALAFARKLAGAAVGRFPLAEIEAAAAACFVELRGAPHLVARVAPDFVEGVRGSLTAAAQDRGFTGRLIVLGDPEVADGDARLEWADGGVVRDASSVAAALDRAVTQRFGRLPETPDEGATP